MTPPAPRRASGLLAAFRFAFAGWGHALRTQRNARIHALISGVVVVAGLWVGLSRARWSLLLLSMGLVWAAELINTALEALVDLASPQEHGLASAAKDASAAAVLAASLAAALVGLLILGPPVYRRLFGA